MKLRIKLQEFELEFEGEENQFLTAIDALGLRKKIIHDSVIEVANPVQQTQEEPPKSQEEPPKSQEEPVQQSTELKLTDKLVPGHGKEYFEQRKALIKDWLLENGVVRTSDIYNRFKEHFTSYAAFTVYLCKLDGVVNVGRGYWKHALSTQEVKSDQSKTGRR